MQDSPNSLLSWQMGQVEKRAELNIRTLGRLMAYARQNLLQHGITLSDDALVQAVTRSWELALMYEVTVVEVGEPVTDD